MKNHYVPRFVLREFVDSRQRGIHVYDKGQGSFYVSSPDDLFAIRDFYDDQTEKRLAELESKISPILKSMLHACRNSTKPGVTNDDMLSACRALVLLQLIRTPWVKNIATRDIEKRHRGEPTMAEHLEAHEIDPTEENLQWARQLQEHYTQDARKMRESEIWSVSIINAIERTGLVMPDVSRAVLGKGLFVVRTESAFVLGDRGAVSTATPDKPLSDPDQELFFPVSPDVALSIAGRRDEIRHIAITSEGTRAVNRSTFQHNDKIASHSGTLLRSLANPR